MRKKLWLMMILLGVVLNATFNLWAESGAESPDRSVGAKEPTLWDEYYAKKSVLEQGEKETRTFNATDRLTLARWCLQANHQTFTAYAIKELLKITEKYKPSSPDDAVLQQTESLLKQLGYVKSPSSVDKHNSQWLTPEKFFEVKEKEVKKLLEQLKSKKEETQTAARNELKIIESVYKIRACVKALDDSNVILREYAVNELKKSGKKNIVPYLIKTGLADKEEKIRTGAISAIKMLDPKGEISTEWYGYYMQSDRSDGGQIRVRAARGLAETGNPSAVDYLIQTMYQVHLTIRASATRLNPPAPNLRTLSPNLGSVGRPAFEVPDMDYWSIKTSIVAPAGIGDGYTLDDQLNVLGRSLNQVTNQNFGSDYGQWVNWYNTNKQINNKAETK